MRDAARDSPASWLVGTWQSDRERTIEGWGKYPPASSEFLEIMKRDLGKLQFRFDGTLSTTLFEGEKTVTPYRVVWYSESQAFVVTSKDGAESGQHVFFESPEAYWVHAGRFIEFFRRVA